MVLGVFHRPNVGLLRCKAVFTGNKLSEKLLLGFFWDGGPKGAFGQRIKTPDDLFIWNVATLLQLGQKSPFVQPVAGFLQFTAVFSFR